MNRPIIGGKSSPAAPGRNAPSVLRITVDEGGQGQRLDNFLIRLLKGVPKTHIYRVIRSGEVRVNKGRAGADTRVAAGDVVRVPPMRLAEPRTEAPAPAREFPVLLEDEHLLAIAKPAGVAVHGGSGVSFGVIEQLRRARPQARFLELVHRLDKETSGILVFARSRKGLVSLQAQLRAHTVDRRYLAVVEGSLGEERGTFDWPILEEGERRKRVAREGEAGIRAITDWKVLERFGIATLVEARLRTGRTHQIRIHFSHAGHPLVGDQVYRDPKKPLFPVPFRRQALHAGHLGWEKPDGGKVSVSTPPPRDFEELLAALRKRLEKPARPKGGAIRPARGGGRRP